jgi:hypothetical protein
MNRRTEKRIAEARERSAVKWEKLSSRRRGKLIEDRWLVCLCGECHNCKCRERARQKARKKFARPG